MHVQPDDIRYAVVNAKGKIEWGGFTTFEAASIRAHELPHAEVIGYVRSTRRHNHELPKRTNVPLTPAQIENLELARETATTSTGGKE